MKKPGKLPGGRADFEKIETDVQKNSEDGRLEAVFSSIARLDPKAARFSGRTGERGSESWGK